MLTEMGHPQPATPAHCDNATAVGICNNAVKKQRSRAMNMRHFWVVDQVENRQFKALWCPGQENLGDYTTKHHHSPHHQTVRPYHQHQKDSPRTLRRALPPSVVRGCAKLQGVTPYQTRVVQPRSASGRLSSHNTCREYHSHSHGHFDDRQSFLNPNAQLVM